MRVIKKSEVREIIIVHVELTLIFLFHYLLCKIAILESLKVLFVDKKQKLLSVDGIRSKGKGLKKRQVCFYKKAVLGRRVAKLFCPSLLNPALRRLYKNGRGGSA